MDELNSRARSLLDAAHSGDDPSDEDAHRVRHAVLLRVGAVGIGTAALATSTAQAKGTILGSLAAKVGAALVVVVGGTAGVTYYSTQTEPKPAVAVVAASPAVLPQAAPQAPRPEPTAALSVEDLPLESEVAPRRPNVRVAPRAVEATEAAPIEARPEQDLEAEMQLIRGADAALRGGRTSEAQSLLAQHAERHPRGLLAQEREGLSLLARCQSGGRAAAQSAAERYVDRAPRSPLATRLKSACGIER
jgi:hypothetical protein